MNKIIFFGGTFDPVHNGHIQMVNHALTIADQVAICPANKSPHKVGKKSSEGEHRLEMLKLAFQEYDRKKIIIWDREIVEGGVNYTIDTLDKFQKQFLCSKIHLMIGMDNLLCFHRWHRHNEILEKYMPIVFDRGNMNPNDARYYIVNRCFFLKGEVDEISSTDIRKKIAQGKPVDDLVPKVVLDYIKKNRLYVKKEKIHKGWYKINGYHVVKSDCYGNDKIWDWVILANEEHARKVYQGTAEDVIGIHNRLQDAVRQIVYEPERLNAQLLDV